MAVQIDSRPATNTATSAAIGHGSNVGPVASVGRGLEHCPRTQLYGKRIARYAPDTRKKRVTSTTTKFLAAGALALAIGSSVAATGTAAADGLDATPMPPAVIDYDGTHNYDTSSHPADSTWPADPTWPAPPSWGTYPGDSSHPCCSR